METKTELEKWYEYEEEKAKIAAMNLPPAEHDNAISELLRRLGI